MDQSGAMRVFVQVIEAGSFSKAGRLCGVTQSSASRRVAALEKHVGAQLIQRSTRRLNMTEAGRIYYQHARQIIADMDNAHQAVQRLSAAPSGVLRLTTPAAFGRLHIAPLLEDFRASYPSVKIGLSMRDSVEDVIGAGYDLAVRLGNLEDSSLVARQLATSRSITCAHPGYIQAAGAPSHPDDLAGHNCLLFRTLPGSNIWHFERRKQTYSVAVTGSLYADNADALLSAAVAGLGIVRLPSWMVASAIDSGGLVPVLAAYGLLPATTPINAVFTQSRHLAPKLRVFIDFLVGQFRHKNW